jgi:hypothetical protein
LNIWPKSSIIYTSKIGHDLIEPFCYSHKAREQGGNVKNWSAALQVLVVGFYVPLSLLMPTGIGFWLDRRAGHGFPVYALIGLGIGTVIMVYGVYRMVQPFLVEAMEETKEGETRPWLVRTITSMGAKRSKEETGNQ